MKNILLLLGGGGARGAVEVSPIEYISANFRIRAVGGTSAGAINGAGVASGVADRLRGIWSTITHRRHFTNKTLPGGGKYSLKPVRKLLRDNNALRPMMPFGVGVIDLAELQGRTLMLHHDLHEQDVEDGVICSGSIPYVVQDNRFQGKQYDDGGVDRSIPRWPLDLSQYDEIHAVFCSPLWNRKPRKVTQKDIDGEIERVERSIEFWHFHRSIPRAKRMLADWKRQGHKIVVYAPASEDIVGGMLDASPALSRQRLAHGDWMVVNRRVL